MSATRILVEGERPYEVVVGHDLASMLPAAVAGSLRVAVVRPVDRPAPVVLDVLSWAGHEVLDLPVPDGEAAKTASVLADCWGALGRAGFTRSDAIVGVGGGATTDLAGFLAASWLRGVRVVQVPTTLLGMVDAAVGGKTGINTAEGKNLVGAFHPPVEVLCDLDALATLPRTDLVAGLAEVIKVGFTSDPVILDLVESDPHAAQDPAAPVLRELVERAVRVKAEVVGADLREDRAGGLGREVLNYGHTFGHAVELAEDYRWRHGHAVAVGMVYVAELARLAGRLAPGDVARHRAVLELVGLPTSYPTGRWDTLVPAMRVDKKARGAMLRFVVLDGVGRPGLLEGPDDQLLRAAYDAVSEGVS
jgi:3-dehydroquinate synthase